MSVMSQEEYVSILMSDCGYQSAAQRRGWLQLRFSKSYSDELTVQELSTAIAMLKEEKGRA